jgi:hypothetical protein
MTEEIRTQMSQFISVCICWSLSVLCAPADARTDSRHLQTVQSKFAAFNQHDVGTIEKTYAVGAILNSPEYHNLVGNKPIADTYRKIFDAIPDAKDNIELIESAGNHVYVQFVLTGHWNGIQDKPINVRILAVYKVDEGRIIDDATYYDRKGP